MQKLFKDRMLVHPTLIKCLDRVLSIEIIKLSLTKHERYIAKSKLIWKGNGTDTVALSILGLFNSLLLSLPGKYLLVRHNRMVQGVNLGVIGFSIKKVWW